MAVVFYRYQRLLWLPTIIELFHTSREANLNSQEPGLSQETRWNRGFNIVLVKCFFAFLLGDFYFAR